MKEKIKNILLGSSFFYTFTIIILMLINLLNSVTTIELHDNEDNLVKINQYKQELLKLENNNCTDVINKMIKFYENTSYNGDIQLKDIFDYIMNEQGYLLYYTDVKNNCSLSEKQFEDYNYAAKFVDVSINTDQILQPYYFQYELSIKDVFSRYVMEADLLNVEYHMRKKYELELISSLIELEKREDEINE